MPYLLDAMLYEVPSEVPKALNSISLCSGKEKGATFESNSLISLGFLCSST